MRCCCRCSRSDIDVDGRIMKALRELLQQHKAGAGGGIHSVCSSHPLVIEAALREAKRRGRYALIEATSNQVNQFGGYTGMTPVDFRHYVAAIPQRPALPMQPLPLAPVPLVPT